MKKLYQLAENENIKIFEDYLPGNVRGFFYRNGKKSIISLHKELDRISKYIVLAEEIGHYYYSCNGGIYFSKSDYKTFGENTTLGTEIGINEFGKRFLAFCLKET